jgi:hypothetical protein
MTPPKTKTHSRHRQKLPLQCLNYPPFRSTPPPPLLHLRSPGASSSSHLSDVVSSKKIQHQTTSLLSIRHSVSEWESPDTTLAAIERAP